MSWLDLHMHSRYSDDGDFSPTQLIRLCRQAGVRVAALADHNTIGGLPEAAEAATENGILLIPAIELDCRFEEKNLHLLGYGIPLRNPDFDALSEEIFEQERAASTTRLALAKELGLQFSEEAIRSLAFHGIITGEMIAEVALSDTRNDGNMRLTPYRPGGNRSGNPYVNFYWDYCAEGKPLHVPIRYRSLAEAISLIRNSGGFPVLAHPAINIGRNATLLSAIVAQGVVGLEAYCSYHAPEIVDFFRDRAREMNLVVTAGSDFHGKTKPSVQLGKTGGDGMEEIMLHTLEQLGIHHGYFDYR